MDKRHYFTQAVNINDINTISRTISETGNVTGYSINGTIALSLVSTDQYELNITIHTKEPIKWKGKVIERSTTEVWTKDGIYLKKNDDENKIYIKDFFEKIGKEYQDIYLAGLMSETPDTTIIGKLAKNVLDNDINGMEFYIHNDGKGIEDEVVAYMNGYYYVNSNNFYHPHLIETDDNIYTDWKILASDYLDLIADPTDNDLINASSGRTFNLYLPSNKLVYLLWRNGINADSVTYLDTTDSPLQHIDTIYINGLLYQVYINILYIYSESGTIKELTSEQQVLEIKNAFNHDDLKGKLVKVW